MPSDYLTGPEIGELREYLRAAISRPRLDDLVYLRLNKKIDDYAASADDSLTVYRRVIEGASMEAWWRDLVREARNMRPGDPGLLGFAQKMGVGPQIVSGPGRHSVPMVGPQLELKIKAAQTTFDVLTWRKKLGEIESRVCRIEFPDKTAQGTGFLVAPDLVLTNYHVVEAVINSQGVSPQAIKVRFDYKVKADGISLNPGKAYGLAQEWLADSSPYSARDLEVSPASDPGDDELDYALLRIDGRPGDDPVGGDTQDPQPVPRGWISPLRTAYDFTKQRAIYIVQHPDGKPMQVAVDSDSVVGVNAAKNRVHYTTTTDFGSSGSPCFSADWEWVALHHAGDPKYAKFGQTPEYNEGIPVSAIIRRLDQIGKSALFANPA
jgi:V8-like Glu-specific endopeptidase